MKKTLQLKIEKFIFEFILVFAGVFLAFAVNDWSNSRQQQAYIDAILNNLRTDVETDTMRIKEAVKIIEDQLAHLEILTQAIDANNYEAARDNIRASYFMYSAYEPTTKTLESMTFAGDIKLIGDIEHLNKLKELDYMNNILEKTHKVYFESIESFKLNFICKYDLNYIKFENLPNKTEFWNRLNFLKEHVKSYHKALKATESSYHRYLTFRAESNKAG